MVHFFGNPNCPARHGVVTDSEAPSEEEFRALLAEFPRDYCSACVSSSARTDSERYAELRKLVEDCQREAMDPASPVVVFDNALRLVLDWRHR